MRPSPLLSAAAAAALLAAVAGPASAATEPAPAKGVASSTVTLLSVAAGGHTVSAGTLELLSDMLGAEAVAKILLTPLTVDGTTHGQQTVTPAQSPVSAPSFTTGSVAPALSGLLGVTSPVLEAEASNANGEPSTSAGAASLGGLNLLGIPVSLDGGLDVSSVVSKTAGAVGTKNVTVEGVALPSIADLLGALGLDLSALPIEVLTELLTELDLVNDAVDTAQDALDAALAEVQTQVDAAQAEVDAAAAALVGPTSQLAAAEADLDEATGALSDAVAARDAVVAANQGAIDAYNDAVADVTAALSVAGLTQAAYDLLPVALRPAAVTSAIAAAAALEPAATTAQQLIANATTAVTTAQGAVDLLNQTIAALQNAINGLQATLDAALAALNGILDTVQAELDALLGAVTAVLDGTPLVSFDSLSIVTEAVASSNKEGGQSAVIKGGELAGLEVLGTDVLSDVLGTSSVDLLDLVGGTLTEVNALIAGLTGTLSSVLSTVPEFPTLSIPAPEVGLLTKSASTDIVDGFGVANTAVKGLSITLPSVSIPTALALPGAADLPALDGITQVAGLLTSAPIKLDLATLGAQSRFAPAVVAAPGTGTPGTGTPGTVTPQLPRTGASQALAVLGAALMAGAIVARRRRMEVAEDLAA